MAKNSLSDFIGRLLKRGRKYPIKRDEFGRTARRRAFDLFEHGKMPAQVALIVGISVRTARRYFQAWKKLPRDLETKYTVAKKLLNSSPEHREEVVKTICELLGLPEEEVRARLQEPWGLKRFMMDRWSIKTAETDTTEQSKEWARFKAALNFIYMLEVLKIPREIMEAEINRMLDNAQIYADKTI